MNPLPHNQPVKKTAPQPTNSEVATLVLLILPGRAEACRRMIQELEGSRQAAFMVWQRQVGVEVVDYEIVGETAVLLKLTPLHPSTTEQESMEPNPRFLRWLQQQVAQVHGLDLTTLLPKRQRSRCRDLGV